MFKMKYNDFIVYVLCTVYDENIILILPVSFMNENKCGKHSHQRLSLTYIDINRRCFMPQI